LNKSADILLQDNDATADAVVAFARQIHPEISLDSSGGPALNGEQPLRQKVVEQLAQAARAGTPWTCPSGAWPRRCGRGRRGSGRPGRAARRGGGARPRPRRPAEMGNCYLKKKPTTLPITSILSSWHYQLK